MARPARFERTTPAFGGQYSIQLSYGRFGTNAEDYNPLAQAGRCGAFSGWAR